jgi:hypothetical protein
MQVNQPQPQKKFILLLIPFIGYFIYYLILYLIISSRRAVFPSSLIEWEAWITVCVFLFVLPEGLILLISIVLRALALRIGNDARLDLEPEAEWSKRQLRWFRRLWRAFSLLSYPPLTIFAPMLVVVGVLAPSLSLLQSLIRAANHSDYQAWIVLALLWILNGLAVIPLIRIWKWFMEADYSPPDEISTD